MLWGPLEKEEVAKQGRKRETLPEGGCTATRGQWPPGANRGLLSTSEVGSSSLGRTAPRGLLLGSRLPPQPTHQEGTVLTLRDGTSLTGTLAIASPSSRVARHRTESERSRKPRVVRASSQGRGGRRVGSLRTRREGGRPGRAPLDPLHTQGPRQGGTAQETPRILCATRARARPSPASCGRRPGQWLCWPGSGSRLPRLHAGGERTPAFYVFLVSC